MFGMLSSVCFAVWAFFDKLSTSQNPFAANFVTYGTAFILSSLLVLRFRRRPSLSLISSGIFGGAVNLLVLLALAGNFLLAVYPFVAAGGIIFFILTYLLQRPTYTKTQLYTITIGLGLAFAGLSISSSALGGSGAIVVKPLSIALGVMITISAGLWTFFASRSIIHETYDARTAAFWIFLVALAVSTLGLVIGWQRSFQLTSLSGNFYPFLLGCLCV